MDLDEIKKSIQNFFKEDTLTIVGSGLSLAEGIPGMTKLASKLQKDMPTLLSDTADNTVWGKINNDLLDGIGLEEALHNTQPTPYIEDCIRNITADYIGQAENRVLYEVLKKKRILRFSEYIQHFNIKNNGMTIVTTNYDRLIEYACEQCNIRIDTLFVGKFIAHFNPEQSKYMFCSGISKRQGKPSVNFAPRVTILKPHGCLSWHLVDGEPYSIPQYLEKDCLIITPGTNKYKEGYSNPFDTHRVKANNAIDNAQQYIIIGYGFGDSHLETHLIRQLKNGKPALILTHSLSKKAKRLVKECKYITAVCCENTVDTKVITSSRETVLKDCNLWDIREMLKEVF